MCIKIQVLYIHQTAFAHKFGDVICLKIHSCHLLLAPSIACCSCFNCFSSIHEHAASFTISNCGLLLQCLYCFCNLVRRRRTTFKPPVDRLLLEAGKKYRQQMIDNSSIYCKLFSMSRKNIKSLQKKT